MSEWLNVVLGVKFKFKVCEIIFGFQLTDIIFEVINFIILVGKWFLNIKKSENSVVYFLEFIAVVKSKLEVLLEVKKNYDKQFLVLLSKILNN